MSTIPYYTQNFLIFPHDISWTEQNIDYDIFNRLCETKSQIKHIMYCISYICNMYTHSSQIDDEMFILEY